jgi:hypothetical protein
MRFRFDAFRCAALGRRVDAERMSKRPTKNRSPGAAYLRNTRAPGPGRCHPLKRPTVPIFEPTVTWLAETKRPRVAW